MVADRRITESACGVEEARKRAQERRAAAKTDCHIDILFVRNERKPASDIDIEYEPNADEFRIKENLETLEEGFDVRFFVAFHPTVGLFQKQMSDEHHNEPNTRQNVQRFFRAKTVNQAFNDGRENHLRRAEARNRKTRGKTFIVLEPEHKRFDGGKITKTQADTHNHAVANKNERHTVQMHGKPRACYADGKANRCNQACRMYILFYEVAEERRAHAKEEDGKRERPTKRRRADTVCGKR